MSEDNIFATNHDKLQKLNNKTTIHNSDIINLKDYVLNIEKMIIMKIKIVNRI